MTFLYSRSFRPVYITVSFRPTLPCQTTQTLAGPIFSHLWNPFLTERRMLRFIQTPLHRRLYQAAGFSEAVSRLAAAHRRPLATCMYDDRGLRCRTGIRSAWSHSSSVLVCYTCGLSPQTTVYQRLQDLLCLSP